MQVTNYKMSNCAPSWDGLVINNFHWSISFSRLLILLFINNVNLSHGDVFLPNNHRQIYIQLISWRCSFPTQRVLLTFSRIKIHARYIRLPCIGRYPREVKSLSHSCVPGTGEITINCTHTLLEIQDKYKGEEERWEKKIPVCDTVFPIEPRCFPSKERRCFTMVSFFSPLSPLIRQALS